MKLVEWHSFKIAFEGETSTFLEKRRQVHYQSRNGVADRIPAGALERFLCKPARRGMAMYLHLLFRREHKPNFLDSGVSVRR
jgi:hypothetical protein